MFQILKTRKFEREFKRLYKLNHEPILVDVADKCAARLLAVAQNGDPIGDLEYFLKMM